MTNNDLEGWPQRLKQMHQRQISTAPVGPYSTTSEGNVAGLSSNPTRVRQQALETPANNVQQHAEEAVWSMDYKEGRRRKRRIKSEISASNVAVIFDGTTRFGEALAIVLRYVTADWKIKQALV